MGGSFLSSFLIAGDLNLYSAECAEGWTLLAETCGGADSKLCVKFGHPLKVSLLEVGYPLKLSLLEVGYPLKVSLL